LSHDLAAPQHEKVHILLDCARRIASDVFAPRANQTDQAASPPVENIRLLADAGLLGLMAPVRFGGHGVSGAVLREYTTILAAACGVTTFLQGQHQSACLLIAGGENEALKERLLPEMAAGKRLGAVAFSHLRRSGPPVMRAERDGDSWMFNGIAPWVTGWGVMQEVVLAGTLPDERLLYVVVPLEKSDTMQPSPPMRLCAMNASATVSLACHNLRVGPERYLKTITREQMARNDLGAILGVTPQPIGVATAAIRLLRSLAQQHHSSNLSGTAEALERELTSVREAVHAWIDRTTAEGYKENALRIRAWCIELGVRAAHAAVAAAGGSANNREHTAQRLFREAMFYTVIAQTRDVQAATLERLTRQSEKTAIEEKAVSSPQIENDG
jgi:alkylation response protein AidB-like acyl-CoA dehydrogenase